MKLFGVVLEIIIMIIITNLLREATG